MDALATTSPFLPATHIQYAWDSTSLGYLKTCPRLYQYIMIEGWQSQIESRPSSLWDRVSSCAAGLRSREGRRYSPRRRGS